MLNPPLPTSIIPRLHNGRNFIYILISIKGREGEKIWILLHHISKWSIQYPYLYLYNGGSVGIFRTFTKSDLYAHGRISAEKISHR